MISISPEIIPQYVQQMSKLMQLPLTAESMAEVITNFQTVTAIAALVTDFTLPREEPED